MSKISPDGDVYQAGTLSGNPIAMSAGIAQLTECLKTNFYTELDQKTKFFVSNCQLSTARCRIFSVGSIFWIAFTEKENIRSAEEIDAASMKHFKKLYHKLLNSGVYLGPSGYEVGFVSSAHSNDDLSIAAKTIQRFL